MVTVMAKKNYTIKRVSAAFNIDDPYQKSLYEHAIRGSNASDYVKRLIQRDMEGGAASYTVTQYCKPTETPIEEKPYTHPLEQGYATVTPVNNNKKEKPNDDDDVEDMLKGIF
jgi:hypothetical protein